MIGEEEPIEEAEQLEEENEPIEEELKKFWSNRKRNIEELQAGLQSIKQTAENE